MKGRNGEVRSALWIVLVVLVCVWSLVPGIVMADEPEEDRPTATFYVDALSQYIFRGVAFSNDSVVLQPSATASYKGFSVNVWGNFDTDEDEDFGELTGGANWNETDVTFSYTHEIYQGLSGTAGGVYYSLIGLDSFEVFAGLSYPLPWFTVAVTGYREVSHFPGWWVQLDLSRNFPLPWYGMSVDLGGTVGFQSADDKGVESDIHAGQVLTALNIPVGKYFTIAPRVGVAFPISDEGARQIRASSWDTDSLHVFGGIRLSAAF